MSDFMEQLEEIKNRFLQEDPKMRLGHLAADLLRIATFIETGSSSQVKPIIYESKFMAEWAAGEADIEVKGLLSEMQSFLALREHQWPAWCHDSVSCTKTSVTARLWSNKLLKRSGLL